jgi:ADP-ribose pyrophosphatase YjhB (NUDIX family)
MNNLQLSQTDYDFIFSKVPRLCVSVVLRSNNGIALSRRKIIPSIGLWHLPGGRVRRGERVIDAAVRVLQFELGIVKCSVQAGSVGYIDAPLQQYENVQLHNVDIVLEARTNDHAFHGECNEVAWHTTCPVDLNPTQADFIKTLFGVNL